MGSYLLYVFVEIVLFIYESDLLEFERERRVTLYLRFLPFNSFIMLEVASNRTL